MNPHHLSARKGAALCSIFALTLATSVHSIHFASHELYSGPTRGTWHRGVGWRAQTQPERSKATEGGGAARSSSLVLH